MFSQSVGGRSQIHTWPWVSGEDVFVCRSYQESCERTLQAAPARCWGTTDWGKYYQWSLAGPVHGPPTQYDVREDEDQDVKLQESINLLLAAGYFRARIKGLSPFDKIVGGMTWCIQGSNFDVDVDLLFQENSTIGQKMWVGWQLELLRYAFQGATTCITQSLAINSYKWLPVLYNL